MKSSHPKSIYREKAEAPASCRKQPVAVAHHGSSGAARAADGESQELLAAYQDRIIELEGTVSGLRERLQELDGTARELRDSRSYLLELFEYTPAGYLVHDESGFISACNRAAAALLGLKRRYDTNASLVQYVAKEDLPLWFDHIRRSAQTWKEVSTELKLQVPEGRLTPVQLLTLPQAGPSRGAPSRFHTILVDNTQRHEAEATLARTQQNYHRLIDTVEGIVWEADPRTLDVIFVSRYAERLLGYPRAEWSRPGFWENHIYVQDRERVTHWLTRALAKREDLRIEYRVLTAARRLLWLHDSITVAECGGGLKLMGVAVDVTERRNAEEALRQAHDLLERSVVERTAELRETVGELEAFSYSVSHDLRAHLRAMLGFAHLALEREQEGLSPMLKSYLQHILSGALRADRLVRDILAYSRVSRANLRLGPIDLQKLLSEILEQHSQFQPPQAEIQVQSPLLPVIGHEASLVQCIINLLSNGIKFVRPGVVPRIKIWTEPVPILDCQIDSQPGVSVPFVLGLVRIWFEDNGIGIEPANLSRIFNMFERVHSTQEYEGTGIGLAIVRKGVERMGGSVGVESEPGAGSRFWIQLKAAEVT